MFIQKNLAKSLRAISEGGSYAFYKGWIADAISEEMEANNGLISREDLAMYEPIVSEPEPGSYRGHGIVYDPTHGGTTLVSFRPGGRLKTHLFTFQMSCDRTVRFLLTLPKGIPKSPSMQQYRTVQS